jgi:hypothetical protein
MNEDTINEFVLWKPIKVVSVIMYSLVLLMFPFSQFWATIMLFALICFWSRIPALISMFTKEFEVIDFFTVMIAIHVNGLFAAVFGAFLMMFTRIFGPREWFIFTVKNSIGIFIGGLLTPLFYSLTGSALYTMYCFTIVRYILLIITTIIIEPEYLMLEIGISSVAIFMAFFLNTVIMKTFEPVLNRVMASGVVFDWSIFFFATIVIGFFYASSRIAKLLEARRQKRILAGEEPGMKAAFYELDADSKEVPLFVNTV